MAKSLKREQKKEANWLHRRVHWWSAAIALTIVTIAGVLILNRGITIIITSDQYPTYASMPINEIVRGNATKKQVIFTFDGGDGIRSADKIMTVLAEHKVTGTFFLTGRFVEKNPILVRKMALSGNEIFNHTYDHPHLPELSAEEIGSELARMDQATERVSRYVPKKFFRAPYGDRDQRVLAAAQAAGYESIYWTVDARDWQESEGETDASVRSRILSTLAPGNIYLMHIGDNITGDILDSVFTEIEKRGYKIVSLTEGL
ncbi:MAG: polysaccharide deacetylase family protein [Candidatus Taylorbacteria bacterium]|nr:polysaccharide deacetylase family protein [Candidatus Taylorbacteria bacterium]